MYFIYGCPTTQIMKIGCMPADKEQRLKSDLLEQSLIKLRYWSVKFIRFIHTLFHLSKSISHLIIPADFMKSFPTSYWCHAAQGWKHSSCCSICSGVQSNPVLFIHSRWSSTCKQSEVWCQNYMQIVQDPANTSICGSFEYLLWSALLY